MGWKIIAFNGAAIKTTDDFFEKLGALADTKQDQETIPYELTFEEVLVFKPPPLPSIDSLSSVSDVALKLMKHKDMFDNEIGQRKGLNAKYVMEVICSSTSEELEGKWTKELKKLGKWSEYEYGIVIVRKRWSLHTTHISYSVHLSLTPSCSPRSPRRNGILRSCCCRSGSTSLWRRRSSPSSAARLAIFTRKV